MFSDEVMLAQEQSVTAKSGRKINNVQGSLILTNRRLLFISAKEEEDVTPAGRTMHFRFTDVIDLSNIPEDPANLSIPLDSILSAKGHASIIENPKLEVLWQTGTEEQTSQFVQSLTGGRKKNLKDWATVISNLKSKKINLLPLAPPPSIETVEGKIYRILGDMQEKGVLEIERRTEQLFNLDLDPDKVEESCQHLVNLGLLDAVQDPSGDQFYRRKSALGQDDLSS